MQVMNQPVQKDIITIPEDRARLRIALIFEELKEYAEACGLPYYFEDLCDNYCIDVHNKTQVHPLDTTPNQVEQLDALLDLEYVVLGAVHEHGFGEIFDKAFDDVHNSNMSKACNTEDIAKLTIDKYEAEQKSCYYKQIGDFFVVYDRNTDKVLKSVNYKPVDLEPYFKQ